MSRIARAALRLVLVACALALGATPAAAHDCATQADCEETTGYIGGIATIGGIIAVITGILGTQLGGGVAGATGGAVGGTTVPGGDGEETPAGAAPSPGSGIATAEPPAPEAEDLGEPEVPWDDLIGATEPEPAGRESGPGDEIDELLGPEEPGEDEPPTDGGAPDDEEEDPLAGEPGIDELVPLDELLEPEPGAEEPAEDEAGAGGGEDEGEPASEPGEGEKGEEPVKPGILEDTERLTDAAGATKDAAEKVSGWGKDLGENIEKAKDLLDGLGGAVSDDTRDKLGELLDGLGERAKHLEEVGGKVGEMAGEIKEYGEKAAEYMNAANDNFERTERMGLTEDSSNFLAWWRVTFKGIGEATQKFVDGLTAPVEKVFGEKAGEMVKGALPVAEFGEELSKLPTSAAETVVKAQQRDQIAENVGLVPEGDAGYIELDDLYPGRKWP